MNSSNMTADGSSCDLAPAQTTGEHGILWVSVPRDGKHFLKKEIDVEIPILLAHYCAEKKFNRQLLKEILEMHPVQYAVPKKKGKVGGVRFLGIRQVEEEGILQPPVEVSSTLPSAEHKDVGHTI